jgi:hypothetical protein
LHDHYEPPPRWVPSTHAGLVRGPSYFWEILAHRVILAGGVYPVVVYAIWGGLAFVIGAFKTATTDPVGTLGMGVVLVATGVVAALVFFLLGLVWTGVVSFLTRPAAALTSRLLDWPAHCDVAGKLTGGLVGYLATFPAAITVSYFANDTFDFLPALFVFAHCGLAIAMGQAAGCLAAVADLRRRRRGKLTASGLRFGVWQLLALTVPVAVVLSILKAADMLNPPMALASIAAAFCAVATWLPVTWLVNRYLDRRLAKRRQRRLVVYAGA